MKIWKGRWRPRGRTVRPQRLQRSIWGRQQHAPFVHCPGHSHRAQWQWWRGWIVRCGERIVCSLQTRSGPSVIGTYSEQLSDGEIEILIFLPCSRDSRLWRPDIRLSKRRSLDCGILFSQSDDGKIRIPDVCWRSNVGIEREESLMEASKG